MWELSVSQSENFRVFVTPFTQYKLKLLLGHACNTKQIPQYNFYASRFKSGNLKMYEAKQQKVCVKLPLSERELSCAQSTQAFSELKLRLSSFIIVEVCFQLKICKSPILTLQSFQPHWGTADGQDLLLHTYYHHLVPNYSVGW